MDTNYVPNLQFIYNARKLAFRQLYSRNEFYILDLKLINMSVFCRCKFETNNEKYE